MAKNSNDESLIDYYKELSVHYENRSKALLKTIEDKDSLIKQFKIKLENASQNVKSKDNRIVDLEFELLASAQTDIVNISSMEKQESNRKDLWIAMLEDKERDIERLENELRKRTCDLQGVVNKELWEKNREIEKLQNRFGNIIEIKGREIIKLEKEVAEKNMQLTILKDKIAELGIHVNLPSALLNTSEIRVDSSVCDETKSLHEQLKLFLDERKYYQQQIDELKQKLRNTPEREEYKQYEQLKTEYNDLREELEKSEKLRHECNDVCRVLSVRLEELARYLNTLLKQKIVLGFLGSKHNNKLQKIVDQSLDLSKTLNLTTFIDPDQSLMQLTNISNLLDLSKHDSVNELLDNDESGSTLSILPEEITLTYTNHLFKKEVEKENAEKDQIIKVLRQQVENLKKEIDLRDNEFEEISVAKKAIRDRQKSLNKSDEKSHKLNKTVTPEKCNAFASLKSHFDNNSESESWSEPDRSVSLARIGLDDECLKPHVNKRKLYDNISTESTEEEISHINRSGGKKNVNTDNRQVMVLMDEKVKMLEAKLKDSEVKLSEEIVCKKMYEEQLDQLQKNIQKLEEKLTCCENSKQEAEKKIEELCIVVNNLEDVKKALLEKMESKDKCTQNKINLLELEKQEALKAASIAEEIAEKATATVRSGEMKIKEMENTERDFKCKIESAEHEIKSLKYSILHLQQIYERDYMKKSEVDSRILEVESIVEQLENFKTLLKSTEHKIQVMEENELDLKHKLQNLEKEHHEKINLLRKELDSATLQYSETVLEKTRIANEKVSLEQQLKKLDFKESELLKQVNDFQEEFSGIKHAFQMQLANIENQKSKLEVKVSELESQNAELKNRLIKIQTGEHIQHSTSLPNSPSRYCDLYGKNISFSQFPQYKRQYSDNSGYTSEEQVIEDPNRQVVNMNAQMAPNMVPFDMERLQANSSPDLGIESDHGRFSSLEANINIPRPLLQTLELTESMNSLLDGDKDYFQQGYSCNNESCCEKTKQMTNENIDLKKRLLRTRRALEETVTQLTIANQRKKQVEKTICRQIHKTSQVLRKAKANLDSGSESELRKN